jgi:cytidylate kinase
MRRWALDIQTRQQLAEEQPALSVPQMIQPYIAISRECGIDAHEFAGQISAHCGWNVLDRELIDHLAEHDHLSRLALEFVDERTVSWFHELFGKWLERQLISQAEYVSKLGRLVLLAAQHESLIFVGRGVQFMLPRECGLVVRLIAPLKQRVECIRRIQNCSEREAKAFITKTDEGRANFVQRYFHHNVTDPKLYDLVINLQQIPRSEAVQIIASQAKLQAERAQDTGSTAQSAARQFRKQERRTES